MRPWRTQLLFVLAGHSPVGWPYPLARTGFLEVIQLALSLLFGPAVFLLERTLELIAATAGGFEFVVGQVAPFLANLA